MALDSTAGIASGSPSTSLFQDSDSSYTVGESSESGDESCCWCFICADEIVERSRSHDGDQAVYCEGRHQQWAHARCVGITDEQYEEMSAYSEPWFCQQCKDNADDKGDEDAEGVKPASNAETNTSCTPSLVEGDETPHDGKNSSPTGVNSPTKTGGENLDVVTEAVANESASASADMIQKLQIALELAHPPKEHQKKKKKRKQTTNTNTTNSKKDAQLSI